MKILSKINESCYIKSEYDHNVNSDICHTNYCYFSLIHMEILPKISENCPSSECVHNVIFKFLLH